MSARRYKSLLKQGKTPAEAMKVLNEEQAPRAPVSASGLMSMLRDPDEMSQPKGSTDTNEDEVSAKVAKLSPVSAISIDATTSRQGDNIEVLCFSKDRPFQLQEFLRSFSKNVSMKKGRIRVSVLFRCDPGSQFYDSYESVARKFPHVKMIRETSFSSQLREFCSSAAAEGSYVMFAVDDVFVFNPFDLSIAADLLRCNEKVFVFHLKLHPHVTFCHPANKPSKVPPFQVYWSDELGEGILTFHRHEGTVDWNYPWDMCCSMYRGNEVVLMLDAIEEAFGKDGISHPNKLEANGALISTKSEAMSKYLQHASMCSCPRSPAMAVITVNRVQDVYRNRIYGKSGVKLVHAAGGDALADGDETTIETLFTLDRTIQLDDSHYQRTDYNSVHIGDLVLQPSEEMLSANSSRLCSPLLSVVMPVYNSERFLADAIESIFGQLYNGKWELIVVDDGSTDGSEAVVQRLVTQHKEITFKKVESLNAKSSADTGASAAYDTQNSLVLLKLGKNRGVAVALDAGIALAKGKYIVRMDSDDICLPTRFQCQVDYLERHLQVAVLGCAVEMFRDDSDDKLASEGGEDHAINRVISLPRDTLSVEWGMWFFCALAHPSVMIRREAVFGESGCGESYTNSVLSEGDARRSCAEDYALWLRLLSKSGACVKMANLGHVLLRLRKHEGNVSSRRQNDQTNDGLQAVAGQLSSRLKIDVSSDDVQCLQRPERANSASQLQAAANVLIRLERSYIEGKSREKTNLEGLKCSRQHECDSMLDKIVEDTTARIQAMCILGLQRFGGDAASLLQLSQSRDGSGSKGLMKIFGF